MNSVNTEFKEFEDSHYTKLRKKLLRTKGSDKQKQFLANVQNTDNFINQFSDIPTIGTTNPALLSCPMTENEFKDPPADTERAMYNSWIELTPSVACRSTFWANLTFVHIRGGYIESTYLAANGGTSSSGAERIDLLLKSNSGSDENLNRIDRCVRTVLRRLGGLPEARGNRSVYVDCPFARAWWREFMTRQATDDDEQQAQRIGSILRIDQTYWEKLIDRIVFRNSTFGSKNIRNAFLRELADFLHDNPESILTQSKGFQRLCRRASAYQGKFELSVLNDFELAELMGEIIKGATALEECLKHT